MQSGRRSRCCSSSTMASRMTQRYVPEKSISAGARMPVRFLALVLLLSPVAVVGQRTQKPALHGRHWVAITGKPLAATAGAMIFQKGGNPVDAACAMLAAVTTMWDVLSWGGETQALIYNADQKGHRDQRPRRRAHRHHAGLLSLQGDALPTR